MYSTDECCKGSELFSFRVSINSVSFLFVSVTPPSSTKLSKNIMLARHCSDCSGSIFSDATASFASLTCSFISPRLAFTADSLSDMPQLFKSDSSQSSSFSHPSCSSLASFGSFSSSFSSTFSLTSSSTTSAFVSSISFPLSFAFTTSFLENSRSF
ncbi:hypothetical protein CLUG_05885 [Clavispora lusitaniae ATCC 42720]|uniref:Uncharacterized protein n=1 Tax=Clavispora lusitaniae (strain ATCC 42720) TaxID=306902 RepID=C4YC68_CLAL4|nr:uncharacterized protein CLUG_05885 [Clavispora lusitaniae ATCC 42720]EEQ41756.1 hypothetical protein CLUG_05885 [Clavispora lusitaniae ATCC 42720]